MLTLSQQVIVEGFAKEVVNVIKEVILTKPVPRTSVRTNNGKVSVSTFSAPVNASGKLIRSLYFEITENSIKFFGEDYIYYLIYGRHPSKGGGSGVVKQRILQWIADKGITPDNGMSRESLAFLITRKIHRYGSSIFIRSGGQNSGLLTGAINKQLLDSFNKKFTAQLSSELSDIFNGK